MVFCEQSHSSNKFRANGIRIRFPRTRRLTVQTKQLFHVTHDDFRLSFQNLSESNRQKSFSGPHSPGRLHNTIT